MSYPARGLTAILIPFLAMALSPLVAMADDSKRGSRMDADLSAFNSVPAVAGQGSGEFKASLRRNGDAVEYRLSYENLGSRVLQAHIHFGKAWENGGILAFLCTNLGNAPSANVPACPNPGGEVTGSILASDVQSPPNSGIGPGDFSALLEAIDTGTAYVNVHTEAIPAGQIRGQVR